jgi:fumarylacetoacetate (FAA) hydrolase
MKLATLRDGSRDGRLFVVSADGTRALPASEIAPSLQAALDDWARAEPLLRERADVLNRSSVPGEITVDPEKLLAPLPRAYEWIDGSAYINHVILVRKARGAEPPATLRTDPLVYQGGSGHFLGPREPIAHFSDEWGIDFEAEVAVVVDDVPMGTTAADAARHIKLLMLVNDVTLRNIVPAELEKGFGFFVSKPATAFSPFAVTPDELGGAWRDGRVHLPLRTTWNGKRFGDPDAGPEMHFSFADLIAHAARTRQLTAGTIIGSGTVSNADPARGASCIAEIRMREKIATGQFCTPYMRFGDAVEIEMFGPDGRSLFGAIRQKVVRAETAGGSVP